MKRQPRNPEYNGLKNERVLKAMNTLEDVKDSNRISKEEYRVIMPILDASFDPSEE